MKKTPNFQGKNIILINSGGKKKKFTIEKMKKLGCTVILVNQVLDCDKKMIDHFIEADTYNHNEVVEKLKSFKEKHPELPFHGAVCFWEDDVPLLARVCEEFKLVGNSYKTAINTRNKYEMRKRLAETGLGSANFHLVKTKNDLKNAIEKIGFPAIMKPAWGADSEFVLLVKNQDEAERTFQYLFENCNEQFNPIFKYNNGQFVYEEYIEGMEMSVECYIQYGIPHVIGINEKQPIKPPYFVEYGDIAPARLSEEEENEAIKLAESSLIAMGVKNSLAHIELKITPQGPKIIEVGSRMGGDDIYFNVKYVWDIDMVEVALQIALGQKVDIKIKEPDDVVICRYFIPDYSGVITNIEGVEDVKKMKGVLHIALTKNVGDAILVPPEGFENAGWVVTTGKNYQEAETLMEKVFKMVEIKVTRFHKDSCLGKTARQDPMSCASLARANILRASKFAKIRAIDESALKKLHIGVVTNSMIPVYADQFKSNPDGEIIRDILLREGYKVDLFDMNEVPLPIKKLQTADLDFVFNLCETIYNSTFLEAHAAALFDILQLPYTGSSPVAIGLAQDKIKVKKILEFHGIPTPEWDYVEDMSDEVRDDLKYPLIVKPSNADNSFGINNASVVTNPTELRKQLEIIVKDYKRPALIEEYVEGEEYDVCLIGNGDEVEVLPLIRSTFQKMPKGYWHIYTSDVRNEEDKKVHDSIKVEKPALKIPKKLDTLISEIAIDVYNTFDCHDYAKVEMRVDKHGNPFVLEINPNPQLGEEDFLPVAAKLAGYKYDELLETILWMAVQRYKDKPPFYHLQY